MASHARHDYEDEHEREDHDDGDDFGFDFHIPYVFEFDLSNLNLKKLGKITDYDISHNHLSVTFGKQWTFEVDGSDFEFVTKHSKLPSVTGGTIDSFSIDGPGKADFSISGLDLSAKALYNAIVNFQGAKVVSLLLGGDETISGSGFGDLIYGGAGDDTIRGNDGRDRLFGGAGDDLITGGRDGDYMTGGGGADTFVLAPRSGLDLVNDFDAGEDVLDLTAFGFTGSVEDFLDEHVEGGHGGGHGRCNDDDEDVIIDLGHGDKIKLEEVSRSELSDANFLL